MNALPVVRMLATHNHIIQAVYKRGQPHAQDQLAGERCGDRRVRQVLFEPGERGAGGAARGE